MGSFLSAGSATPGTATAAATATLPSGLAGGDRVYVLISSGAANPNAITDPVTAVWHKMDEWAPDGSFKSALYYLDVTAGTAVGLSGSSHTWTFATSARTACEWVVYRDVDQSRTGSFAKISAPADTVAATPVPAVTPGTYDWAGFAALGRQSPGTDPAKTWTISGFSSDVERVDASALNAGTGQKLSVALYDTNGPASAAVPAGGGGGGAMTVTVTDARPVNTFNSVCLNSGDMRVGATLDKTTLDIWKPRLLRNEWLRIFPDQDKLPPDWSDSRFAYCRDTGAHPFISTKIDGDATKLQGIYDFCMAMPSWLLDDPAFLLWYIEHHEPEKEYVEKYGSKSAGAARFDADFTAAWNKINTLPAPIRAKIRMGPAQTSQWTEVASKGNFDYSLFDPGVGDFWGCDVYHSSNSGSSGITSYIPPATFYQYLRPYVPKNNSVKIFPELGVINALGDDTGSGRAAWYQGSFDEFKTWNNFGGAVVWNDHGTPSTTSVTGIGKARYFELDLRYAGEDTPGNLPKVTTTITYGGGGGGSSARSITPNVSQANIHLWSFTVPMLTPAAPVAPNAWSNMGLPIK